MLSRILSDHERRLLADERRLLGELRVVLGEVDAEARIQRALADSLAQLDELFLLVVVGEFNSGKSAFLNALLGERLLEQGVTPTTSRVHLLRHGASARRLEGEGGVLILEEPIELLREINLVDTPGTNAIDRSHEALTQEFVPRADLVLFVTSADRPFTESERAFLQRLREWGKKVVVVLNKVDILEHEDQVETVERFIADNCVRLLGFVPEIFPVSAKRALAALQASGEAASAGAAASGLPALEGFVRERLDEAERFRLKLLNPLGVAERLAGELGGGAAAQSELLRDDLRTLEDLEGQLEQYRRDMEREFRFRLGDVDKLLHALENRGDRFFDDTLRLGRLPDLLNRARLERQFEQDVIADMPQEVERQVTDLVDWMVDSELRQWRALAAVVEKRRGAHGSRAFGELGAGIESSRRGLLDTLGQRAQGAVGSYDRRREANRLAESVQLALAGAALLEVGAIGLGSIVAAAATSTAMDITGILAAGALATLGLFVIPARRRQAKRALASRLDQLRLQLMEGLSAEFEGEIRRSLSRLEEATAPYTRFVRAERERLERLAERLRGLVEGMATLRREIEAHAG